MTKTLCVYWIRHAESQANCVSKNAQWFQRWRSCKLRDPPLSGSGIQKASAHLGPKAQLVVCSHLRRSKETALQLYPDSYIYELCGLCELLPFPVNHPNYSFVSTRVVPYYNRSECNSFACRSKARFVRQLRALIKEKIEDKEDDNQVMTIAVIGHELWMNVCLCVLKRIDNLEIIERTYTFPKVSI